MDPQIKMLARPPIEESQLNAVPAWSDAAMKPNNPNANTTRSAYRGRPRRSMVSKKRGPKPWADIDPIVREAAKIAAFPTESTAIMITRLITDGSPEIPAFFIAITKGDADALAAAPRR